MEVDNFAQSEIDARLEDRREANQKRGDRTWALFYWQIGTFGVGVLFLVAAVAWSVLINEGRGVL